MKFSELVEEAQKDWSDEAWEIYEAAKIAFQEVTPR